MSAIERRPWPRNPRYLVGEDGTIIGPGSRGQSPGELTPAQTPRGYQFVNVWPRGQRRSEYVHVIVCETFHGPRPDGMEVAHDNGIRRDNRAVNLSWKTPKGNQDDRRRHGTDTRGEDHAPAKLTEYAVREIRRRAAGGESHRALGREFDTCQQNISRIVTRRTWVHI